MNTVLTLHVNLECVFLYAGPFNLLNNIKVDVQKWKALPASIIHSFCFYTAKAQQAQQQQPISNHIQLFRRGFPAAAMPGNPGMTSKAINACSSWDDRL